MSRTDKRERLLGVIPDRFRTQKWRGIGMLLPVIALFLFITVFPVVYGVWLSLHTGRGMANLDWAGISNYATLFASAEFWDAMVTGVYYAVYSVGMQVIMGVLVALALHNWEKFSGVVRGFIFLPYMIPTVAVAVLFRWILNPQIGMVNYYLKEFGIVEKSINFLSQDLAMHTLVWASSWKWSIFVLMIVLARLQSIDADLYEMAKINGASTLQQFRDITWPNIRNVLILIVLLRSIWQFNKFDIIWLLTRGGPFEKTQTLTVLAYENAFQSFDFGTGSAITTIMFVLLFVFAMLYFRIFEPSQEVESY